MANLNHITAWNIPLQCQHCSRARTRFINFLATLLPSTSFPCQQETRLTDVKCHQTGTITSLSTPFRGCAKCVLMVIFDHLRVPTFLTISSNPWTGASTRVHVNPMLSSRSVIHHL